MANSARNNHTTIRYSDDVKKIVDKAEGKTFGDKFENICLDYKEKKEEREEHIKSLDKEIKLKKKELEKLSEKIYNLKYVAREIESLAESLKKINENEIDE